MKVLNCREQTRRKWMVKQGKSHMFDFQDSQIKELRQCFNSLDYDGSGSIDAEELSAPLIGLGLVNSVEEVIEMMKEYDDDGSCEIEFDEFLKIILSLKDTSNLQ